jgi:hypothetical protein
MKRIIAAASIVLGMNFGIGTHASAQTNAVRATVPFDFAVGSRVIPRGIYRISLDGEFLSFTNSNYTTHLFATAGHGVPTKHGRSVLVFDKVQDKYFLRKIITASAATTREWPVSEREKKAQEMPTTLDIYAENSSR